MADTRAIEHELSRPIPTRPDIELKKAHYLPIAGNITFLILVLMYAFFLIGNVALIVFSTILIAFFGHRDNQAKEQIKEVYSRQRLTEILPMIENQEMCQKIVDGEFAEITGNVEISNFNKTVGFISFFVLLFISYERVSVHLSDFNSFFNILFSTILCFLISFWILILWFAVNSVLAKQDFSFLELRDGTPWVNKLIDTDHNDIILISKQSKINSFKMKAETLTHESVLFSALSFSAFLTLIISEQFYLSNPKFDSATFKSIIYLSESVITGSIKERNIDLLFILRANSIDIISIFLLLCAAFFLCTIIARARFNERFHDAENLLFAADKLNLKEEAAIASKNEEDKIKYNSAIYTMIDGIDKLENSLAIPILQMRLNRNLGLSCFMVCLIVCGNLFSPYVAAGIFFILTVSIFAAIADNIWRDLVRGSVFDQNNLLRLLNPLSQSTQKTRAESISKIRGNNA